MPFPRITTRRWMIAVAVVGTVCGVAILSRRSAAFRERAAQHSLRAGIERAMLTGFIARNDDPSGPAYAPRRRRIAHFRALAGKYERAARRPWLPVPPDPPPPE